MSWEGRSLSWPISCILSFLRCTGKGESQTVQRLRREVSVIRNLGYNYKLARRKKHGGGLSLWSTTPNEFSLFLMEKSHICKIKSQCLFDERICWLCHPFFQYHVLGKVSENVQPLVKGIRAEQAAGFYPCFKALWGFLRKTTPSPPGVPRVWLLGAAWPSLHINTGSWVRGEVALHASTFWPCRAQTRVWLECHVLFRCLGATLVPGCVSDDRKCREGTQQRAQDSRLVSVLW